MPGWAGWMQGRGEGVHKACSGRVADCTEEARGLGQNPGKTPGAQRRSVLGLLRRAKGEPSPTLLDLGQFKQSKTQTLFRPVTSQPRWPVAPFLRGSDGSRAPRACAPEP